MSASKASHGKVVLVTGASRGIAAAIAERLGFVGTVVMVVQHATVSRRLGRQVRSTRYDRALLDSEEPPLGSHLVAPRGLCPSWHLPARWQGHAPRSRFPAPSPGAGGRGFSAVLQPWATDMGAMLWRRASHCS